MARFDVFANPTAAERGHTPYFLDVQNDFIAGLDTRVVVALRTESAFGPRAQRLNPTLDIDGESVVLDTATLSAVPLGALKRPVMRLSEGHDAVRSALDALFGA